MLKRGLPKLVWRVRWPIKADDNAGRMTMAISIVGRGGASKHLAEWLPLRCIRLVRRMSISQIRSTPTVCRLGGMQAADGQGGTRANQAAELCSAKALSHQPASRKLLPDATLDFNAVQHAF